MIRILIVALKKTVPTATVVLILLTVALIAQIVAQGPNSLLTKTVQIEAVSVVFVGIVAIIVSFAFKLFEEFFRK